MDNTSQIDLSIIVPVYNAEIYIKDCLNSLLAQTLHNIEIICIDDGSSDNSAKILQEFSQKYPQIVYTYQQNSGPGIARQKGIMLAKGKYIGSIDNDDTVSPDYFKKLYLAATKYPDVEIVYHDSSDTPFSNECLIEKTQDKILLIDHPALWRKIYKKDFLQKYYKGWSCANFVEDYETWFLLLVASKRILIQTNGGEYYHRDNQASLSRKMNSEQSFNYIEIFKDMIGQIKQYDIAIQDKKLYLNAIMKSWEKVSTHLFYNLDYVNKRKYISFMRKQCPEISKSIPHLNTFWKIVKKGNVDRDVYLMGKKIYSYKKTSI